MPKEQCEILHMDRSVARIGKSGHCKIYFKSFMPYMYNTVPVLQTFLRIFHLVYG